MNKLNENQFNHESRIVRLEVMIENINQTLIRMENKLDKIESNMQSDFRWLLSLMILFAGILCGLIAKGFHWY